MSILTTVYGRVDENGSALANGENWWSNYSSGTYAGAFCSQQAGDGIYRVMFAPGTFPDSVDPADLPAFIVTPDDATGAGVRSARITKWNLELGDVNGTPVSALLASIEFKNRNGNYKNTSFDFVATGLLGEALTTTVAVSWPDGGDPTVDSGSEDLACDHPMTLHWEPQDANGNPTTDFYITTIMGLPPNIFGVPQGRQRTDTVDTPLVWKAFNNCPDQTSYQYTICVVKGNEAVCVDPKITNVASSDG